MLIFQKETVTAKVNMKAYTYVLKTINKTKKTKTENLSDICRIKNRWK